jgi:hypothetical protein
MATTKFLGTATTKFLGTATLKFLDGTAQTLAPDIIYQNRIGFGGNYDYTWRVKNNDASTATVTSETTSPPFLNGVSLSSGATSGNITDGPFGESVTIYARATASGKTASNITSIVVP